MSPLRGHLRLLTLLLATVSVLVAGLFSAAPASAAVVTSANSPAPACSSSVAAVVVALQPENRVKGFLPAGPPRTGVSTSVSPNSVRGFDLFLRLSPSGVTVYVNGDPVNLTDPTGHHPAYDSNFGGEQAQQQADYGAALQHYRSANANANAAAKAGPAIRGHAAWALGILEGWAAGLAADVLGAQMERRMSRGDSSGFGSLGQGPLAGCRASLSSGGVDCPDGSGGWYARGTPPPGHPEFSWGDVSLNAVLTLGTLAIQEIPGLDAGADAALAARFASKGADTVAVIGARADTQVAETWAGHEVLHVPNWDLPTNDAWVKSVADRGMDVYTASPTTFANLWNVEKGRERIFARELRQFTNDYGYTWDGNYLRAPSP